MNSNSTIKQENNFKKCPMCAEQIPADAVFCPYCGTRFGEEALAAPPPTAPAVVISPPAPVNVQPASPVFPPAKKSRIGLWIAGALVLVILGGVIGVLLWNQRTNIPAFSVLLATPTPTFTPTLPPTLTPTITPTSTPTPTATVTPIPAWINDFAQPILAAIENRRPDLENDYSGDKTVFASCDPYTSCEVADGVFKMRNHSGWITTVAAIPNDFVWLIEFTPRVINPTSGMGIGWSQYSVELSPQKGTISFSDAEIGTYPSDIGLEIASRVLLIVKGDRLAVFLNGYPIYYADGLINSAGFIKFGIGQVSGSTEINIDNVKFWRLNNIPNLP